MKIDPIIEDHIQTNPEALEDIEVWNIVEEIDISPHNIKENQNQPIFDY